MEQIFRHSVFKLLPRKRLLTPARIGGADATDRENLARYLTRTPFSMNKISYDTVAQTVICLAAVRQARRRWSQGRSATPRFSTRDS